jgi:hypothetical protein
MGATRPREHETDEYETLPANSLGSSEAFLDHIEGLR